jgi:serine/threonine-protein kinase HipA
MNLPEGALREHLRLRFAKAVGTFDDFDLLGIVGRTQIGRIRYSALDRDLVEDVPFQSIDEILRARRGGELFDHLLETFAVHSGLSGVQPKVMIRGDTSGPPERYHIRGATHIVKFWHAGEYPVLAANEFFCLKAARALGLDVPKCEISEDGAALIVERFDLEDGRYLGFEDFCGLNGLGTEKKYSGGYETRLFKRLRDFVQPSEWPEAAERLLKLFVLNCAIRNGDAHLKNFGVIYQDVNGPVQLAPVYDLVTTVADLPVDRMALTLGGSTDWPDRKKLTELGQIRADLGLKRIEEILEQAADAVAQTAPELRSYFNAREHSVGVRIEAAWRAGLKESLGFPERELTPKNKSPRVPRMANSDDLLLEHLRKSGGVVTGTWRAIAQRIGVPESTLSAAVKRLVDRGLVSRGSRRLELASKEAWEPMANMPLPRLSTLG